MTDQAQCNRNPSSAPSPSPAVSKADPPRVLPSAPLLSGLTPTAFLAELSTRLHNPLGLAPISTRETKEPQRIPQRTWEEGPYTLDRARVVLDEMATYLCFVRDRLEDHAEQLPKSPDREAQLEYETPYEIATEMWQVANEAEVQLSELIDRMKSAAWVTQEELDAEFEELAEAAAG